MDYWKKTINTYILCLEFKPLFTCVPTSFNSELLINVLYSKFLILQDETQTKIFQALCAINGYHQCWKMWKTTNKHNTQNEEKGKRKVEMLQDRKQFKSHHLFRRYNLTSNPSKLMDFLNSKTSENITGWLTIQWQFEWFVVCFNIEKAIENFTCWQLVIFLWNI